MFLLFGLAAALTANACTQTLSARFWLRLSVTGIFFSLSNAGLSYADCSNMTGPLWTETRDKGDLLFSSFLLLTVMGAQLENMGVECLHALLRWWNINCFAVGRMRLREESHPCLGNPVNNVYFYIPGLLEWCHLFSDTATYTYAQQITSRLSIFNFLRLQTVCTNYLPGHFWFVAPYFPGRTCIWLYNTADQTPTLLN